MRQRPDVYRELDASSRPSAAVSGRRVCPRSVTVML